jgi:hypothetical protein
MFFFYDSGEAKPTILPTAFWTVNQLLSDDQPNAARGAR